MTPTELDEERRAMRERLEALWQPKVEALQADLKEQHRRYGVVWSQLESILMAVGGEASYANLYRTDYDPSKDTILDQNIEKIVENLNKAKHFQVLLDAINSNTLLKAQWDKLLMTLRLLDNGNKSN